MKKKKKHDIFIMDATPGLKAVYSPITLKNFVNISTGFIQGRASGASEAPP